MPAHRAAASELADQPGCSSPGFNFAGAGLACTDVSFESPGNSSGPLTLYGSVVRPLDGGTESGIALLISGSGGNNRWEESGVARPLLDVAVALAQRGLAVLAYDKRSCSASPYCTRRKFCATVSQNTLPACSSCPTCVNVYLITLYDFIADAVAAAEWFKSYTGVADPASLVIAGHSQGSLLAPIVAHKVNAKNVATLAGTGVPNSEVVAKQIMFQLPEIRERLHYALLSNASDDYVQDIKGSIEAAECTANYSQPVAADVLNNKPSGFSNSAYQIPAFLPFVGGYVSQQRYESLVQSLGQTLISTLRIEPNVTYCPFQHINVDANCLCQENYLNVSTAAGYNCSLRCERMIILGLGGPSMSAVPFVKSWQLLSSMDARASSWAKLDGARALAVNSWTDEKVPRAVWTPLHDVLSSRTSEIYYPSLGSVPVVLSSGAASVSTAVFANLTHDMYDFMDPYTTTTPFSVRPDVLATITNWVCQVMACKSAGSPASLGDDSSNERHWKSVLAGSVLAAAFGGAIIGAIAWSWATRSGTMQERTRLVSVSGERDVAASYTGSEEL